MSNRVEDLERQVAELQAAVNGLTEELVEMKERVRQVEDTQEVSVAADASGSTEPAREESADEASEATAAESEATGGERQTHSDDHVEVVERTDDGPAAGEDADGEADTADGEDVIVPEQEATTPDAEAAEESEADGESDEESDSDIIVA